MYYTPEQAQCFRDTQGARISRWIRDSEVGWMFLAPHGRAYHLLTDEADALEREGQALVERALMGGFAPSMPIKIAASGLGLLGVAAGMKLTGDEAVEVFFAIALLFVGLMCIGKTLNELLYERALRKWRRSNARRLECAGRGGVPEAVATYHRRHNLFQWLFMGSAILFIGRVALLGRDQTWIDAVLFAVCALTVWPMQQIDKTHRRRKWFD